MFSISSGGFSANSSYHFKKANASGKLVPLVTGGYSLIFREGTASWVNLGADVNYWFRERVSLRLEFRMIRRILPHKIKQALRPELWML